MNPDVILYYSHHRERGLDKPAERWRGCVELRDLPTIPNRKDWILSAGHYFLIQRRLFSANRVELESSHAAFGAYELTAESLRSCGWSITEVTTQA